MSGSGESTRCPQGMKVGILALQGAFREHREVLDALGVESVEVRVPSDLAPSTRSYCPAASPRR